VPRRNSSGETPTAAARRQAVSRRAGRWAKSRRAVSQACLETRRAGFRAKARRAIGQALAKIGARARRRPAATILVRRLSVPVAAPVVTAPVVTAPVVAAPVAAAPVAAAPVAAARRFSRPVAARGGRGE
jgi:hypothetical protein